MMLANGVGCRQGASKCSYHEQHDVDQLRDRRIRPGGLKTALRRDLAARSQALSELHQLDSTLYRG